MHCYALSLVLQSKQNVPWAMLGFCRKLPPNGQNHSGKPPQIFRSAERGSRRGREDRLLGKEERSQNQSEEKVLDVRFQTDRFKFDSRGIAQPKRTDEKSGPFHSIWQDVSSILQAHEIEDRGKG